MHERYDRDERRLVATAAQNLWTDALLDLAVDAAAPILDRAQWRGVPDNAPPRWSERSTAILALAALALRTTRTAALTVRAGWAAEAWGDLRRLHEAAGHAREVALDASGQYAENWLRKRGRAGKAPAARAQDSDEGTLWAFMSGMAHADFEHYVNLSASWDEERGLIHNIGPRRDVLWDNTVLWLAARQFVSVLACVLKVHSHLDDSDFLAAATKVHAGEDRLNDELGAALRS